MKLPFRLVAGCLPVLFLVALSYGQSVRSKSAHSSAAQSGIAGFVDPLLGVAGGGNVFPGAAVPFGMIKPGPDMVAPEGHDANAGWNADGDIRGFSQTHVSGTGGGAKYGNILVEPTTGEMEPLYPNSPRADEKASAGLYSVTLARTGIGVEITAARRSAIYRFQYPAGGKANLLFDVSHCLRSGVQTGEAQSLVSAEAVVLSPTEVTGSTTITGGWNKQPNTFTVYFYAKTDTPAESWGTGLDNLQQPCGKPWTGSPKNNEGAWLTFAPKDGRPVQMKIGISFISIPGTPQSRSRNPRLRL